MEKCKHCKATNGRLVQRLAADWGHEDRYELVCVDEQLCWSTKLQYELFRGWITLSWLAQHELLT